MNGWWMLRAKKKATPSASRRHTSAPTRSGVPSGGMICNRTTVPVRSRALVMTFAPWPLMSTTWQGYRCLLVSTTTGHETRVLGCRRRFREGGLTTG
jgi:hypothetical protein